MPQELRLVFRQLPQKFRQQGGAGGEQGEAQALLDSLLLDEEEDDGLETVLTPRAEAMLDRLLLAAVGAAPALGDPGGPTPRGPLVRSCLAMLGVVLTVRWWRWG